MIIRLFLFVFLNLLFALNDSLPAQNRSQNMPLPPGYPDRSASLDVLPGFKNPPAGLFADTLKPAWMAELPAIVPTSSTVAIRMRMEPGFYGCAACPEPIRLNCGKGVIRLGDLNDNESLRTYSGGMWYRKSKIR